MHDAPDMDLLQQYAHRNSDEAFAALVTRHLNMVYSAALRKTGNPHAAEEITQAVFIILAKKARSLRNETILSGWLYQTARLTAVNFLRNEIRRAHREQEAYMQSLSNETESNVWPQIAPHLEDAMGQLGEKDRNAIALRFFEGKSFQEVGTAVGASENAAKKRVAHALEKLRKYFSKRGVVSTTAIIAGVVSANSVSAAPTALATSITAVAITKGAVASGSTLTLVKGALKLMAWTKAKTAVVGMGILLVAGTGAVIVKNNFFYPREPDYQGRRLSNWLADIHYKQPQEKRTKAGEAIRRMGTKTLPFLLADLGSTNFSKVHYVEPDKRTADERNNEATWAFDALGPLGGSAIPELNKILKQNPGYVPGALAGIGRDALPALLSALTNEDIYVRDNTAAYLANAIYSQKISSVEAKAALPTAIQNLTDTNSNIRWRAAGLIAALKLEPDISVPALADGLMDTHISVAETCARALGGFRENAKSAVPALIKILNSTNAQLRSAASQSLSLIDPTATIEAALPRLLEDMGNLQPTVRMQAIQSIGNFGTDARDAVPKLIVCLRDENEVVRMKAAQSLGLIAQNSDEVLRSLYESLHDSSRVVRIESINALAKFGKAAQIAVPRLLELAETDSELRNNVTMALSKIDPQAAAKTRLHR